MLPLMQWVLVLNCFVDAGFDKQAGCLIILKRLESFIRFERNEGLKINIAGTGSTINIAA